MLALGDTLSPGAPIPPLPSRSFGIKIWTSRPGRLSCFRSLAILPTHWRIALPVNGVGFLMPVFQNRIHIGPIHSLLFHHGGLVSHADGLVRKAHIHPARHIGRPGPPPCGPSFLRSARSFPTWTASFGARFLSGHRGTVPNVQQGQDPHRAVPKLGEPLEMGLGPLHRIHPLLFPADGFPLVGKGPAVGGRALCRGPFPAVQAFSGPAGFSACASVPGGEISSLFYTKTPVS